VSRFYSIDQANARLRDLVPVLRSLKADRDAVAAGQRELASFRQTNGNARHAEDLKARETKIAEMVFRMERHVTQIVEWDVTLRDIETGLVDFPALVNGRQVCLCWRLGEPTVSFWHRQNEGFASRRAIADLPITWD
jgi:hypothetical protein